MESTGSLISVSRTHLRVITVHLYKQSFNFVLTQAEHDSYVLILKRNNIYFNMRKISDTFLL